jgi:hypothetical protein
MVRICPTLSRSLHTRKIRGPERVLNVAGDTVLILRCKEHTTEAAFRVLRQRFVEFTPTDRV